jgi:hypothetical protein
MPAKQSKEHPLESGKNKRPSKAAYFWWQPTFVKLISSSESGDLYSKHLKH